MPRLVLVETRRENAELQADSLVARDEKGQHDSWFGTLRLSIPPDLVGEEKEEGRRGKFEERTLAESSKVQKGMVSGQRAALLEATRQGFEYHGNSMGGTFKTQLHQPMSSFASVSDVDHDKFALDAFAQYAPKTRIYEDEAESKGHDPQAEKPEKATGAQPDPLKTLAANLVSTRANLWATMRDRLGLRKKGSLQGSAVAGAALHSSGQSTNGDIFINPVQERQEIAQHLMGIQTLVDGSN